jgi:uncharacterized repeat protein (TIGR03803 family)
MKFYYILIVTLLLFYNDAKSQYLLYGHTCGGGAYNDGVIFRYNPFTNKDTVLFNFDNTNGFCPEGNFYLATNGLLYSTTEVGGRYNLGTAFSFNPKTFTHRIIINFNDTNGEDIRGVNEFTEASNGLLYGTAWQGGTYDNGVIFSYDTNSGKDSVCFNFDSLAFPCRSLFWDSVTGKYYGTVGGGGKYGVGGIHCFNPLTNKDSTLVNFDTIYQPQNTLSGFIRATNGLLYSMAEQGGDSNYGVIYTYDISTGTLKVVFSFNGIDGMYPYGNNLLQLSSGMMYGMTYQGGSKLRGVIFSFNPATDSEKVLVNLDDTTGTFPLGNLIQDPDNSLLYGMTYIGGKYGKGTVFSYNISTSTFTKIFDFNGTNGASPLSGFTLVKDSDMTGLNEIDRMPVSTNIYPNPNDGNFTVDLSNVCQDGYIIILSSQGQNFYTVKINKNAVQVKLHIPAHGLYLYGVYTLKDELISRGKLIVE